MDEVLVWASVNILLFFQTVQDTVTFKIFSRRIIIDLLVRKFKILNLFQIYGFTCHSVTGCSGILLLVLIDPFRFI